MAQHELRARSNACGPHCRALCALRKGSYWGGRYVGLRGSSASSLRPRALRHGRSREERPVPASSAPCSASDSSWRMPPVLERPGTTPAGTNRFPKRELSNGRNCTVTPKASIGLTLRTVTGIAPPAKTSASPWPPSISPAKPSPSTSPSPRPRAQARVSRQTMRTRVACFGSDGGTTSSTSWR